MTWRLLLSLAIVALTVLALSGRVEPQLARNMVTGHLVLAIAALGLNLLNRRRLLSAVTIVQEAEPALVEAPTEPPPDDVAALLSEIRALGFQLIGITDTVNAGHPIRTWILVEPSGETWVEVGLAGEPLAVFLSQVTGERLVETAFPTGATIDDPRLSAQVVDTTPPSIGAPGADGSLVCPASPVFTPPTATDGCDGAPEVIEISDVTTPGACAGSYSRTKIWQARDCSGNLSATVSQTTPIGRGLVGLCATDGAVFAANNADGTVVRIDAQDGRAHGLVAVGHAPTDVAARDGLIWVSIQSESAM